MTRYELHSASTTDDMIAYLRELANLGPGSANLGACADRLEALYMGEEKTAIRDLQKRVADLENLVLPVR